MTGFTILLRKELTEAWRTRRLPVVVVLFVVIESVALRRRAAPNDPR